MPAKELLCKVHDKNIIDHRFITIVMIIIIVIVSFIILVIVIVIVIVTAILIIATHTFTILKPSYDSIMTSLRMSYVLL